VQTLRGGCDNPAMQAQSTTLFPPDCVPNTPESPPVEQGHATAPKTLGIIVGWNKSFLSVLAALYLYANVSFTFC